MDINQIMAKVTDAIEKTYFPHLVNSYANWTSPAGSATDSVKEQMIQAFKDGLSYTIGRNYIKIISSRNDSNKTVHSFIVLKPTKGFEIGDILKAAGWNAPATNFKRGNVFELWSLPAITWTGAG